MSDGRPFTVIGDGIENPHNARTLRDAALLFGGVCRFRDRAHLAPAWHETFPEDDLLPVIAPHVITATYDPVLALETLPHAASVYGYRPPAGSQAALIVGNERRGIAHEMQTLATDTVRIPLAARSLTSINVAASAAVALYYLTHDGIGPQHSAAQPGKRRPELLLSGGADHWELGSAIRSAGAFGWERLLLEDRAGIWFGVARGMRAEGRAAARRAHNAIRLIPSDADARYAYRSVIVITAHGDAMPLHRVDLAGGSHQVVVLPDEGTQHASPEEWRRLCGPRATVTAARVALPGTATVPYHYRLIASIALAEIARQVGARPTDTRPAPRRRTPRYDATFPLLHGGQGERVALDDLAAY